MFLFTLFHRLSIEIGITNQFDHKIASIAFFLVCEEKANDTFSGRRKKQTRKKKRETFWQSNHHLTKNIETNKKAHLSANLNCWNVCVCESERACEYLCVRTQH